MYGILIEFDMSTSSVQPRESVGRPEWVHGLKHIEGETK